MKSIFVTRPIPDRAIQLLRDHGYDVDVRADDTIPTETDIIDALSRKSYDAVICLLTDHITTSVFDAAPSVMLYTNYATGYDNIDVTAAVGRGITVTNAPAEASGESVAEHTIALMFALSRRIVEADSFVRQGKYHGWSPMNFIGADLASRTLGLVGVGRIGKRVAQLATALGLHIVYTDIHPDTELDDQYNARFVASVDELLPAADMVSIHVPLLPSTHHLINRDRLRAMKSSAFLINTSRGAVIDELALVEALRDGVIRGAALDVFEHEPDLTPGLADLPNVILTPHIASASEAARNEMAEVVAHNIIDFFEGRVPRNKISI